MDEFRRRLQSVELNQSTVSLGLGVIVVFIVGLLLYAYFNRLNRPAQPILEPLKDQEVQLTVEGKLLPPGAVEYVVAEGDWLSKIALQYYDDMTQWEKIYEQNKDTLGEDPHLLQIGMRLIIPDAQASDGIGGPPVRVLEETPETGLPIPPTTYTVQPGDHLCKLGARFFGDCTVGWEIYALNRDQIANPHLIYPDQVFKLPTE